MMQQPAHQGEPRSAYASCATLTARAVKTRGRGVLYKGRVDAQREKVHNARANETQFWHDGLIQIG